jgi:hypothetical protein
MSDERPAESPNGESPNGKPAEIGSLVAQPHGGKIWQGKPRNPGPGRPPSEIRRLARLGFESQLPELLRIAKSGMRENDRLKAIDILARYGLGEAKHYDGDLVQKLATEVRTIFGQPDPRMAAAIELVRSMLTRPNGQEDPRLDDIAAAIRTAFQQEDPRLQDLADAWKMTIAAHLR